MKCELNYMKYDVIKVLKDLKTKKGYLLIGVFLLSQCILHILKLDIMILIIITICSVGLWYGLNWFICKDLIDTE